MVYEENIKLNSKNFPSWIYCDTPIKRAKGVAIGFSKRIKFTLIEKRIDVEGRFMFAKIKLGDRTYTLANVYCPNRDPIRYLSRTLVSLGAFKEGETILAGDFNFCLDPALDRSSGTREVGKKLLMSLGRKFHDNQLIDVWRVQHPKERDYSFFSPVHRTYSRLDYLMVDHSLLEGIVESKIETVTLSDHAPVSMLVKFRGLQRVPFSWRFNEDLLKKDSAVNKIKREIDKFFSNNESSETTGAVL